MDGISDDLRKYFPVIADFSEDNKIVLFSPVAKHFSRYNRDFTAKHLRALLDVCKFMHSKGIFHRDLRPSNLLMSNGHLLVNDFGCAVQAVTSDCFVQYRGSPYGVFPGELNGNCHIPSRKTDLFQVFLVFAYFIYANELARWIKIKIKTAENFLGIFKEFAVVEEAFNLIDENEDDLYDAMFKLLEYHLRRG